MHIYFNMRKTPILSKKINMHKNTKYASIFNKYAQNFTKYAQNGAFTNGTPYGTFSQRLCKLEVLAANLLAICR